MALDVRRQHRVLRVERDELRRGEEDVVAAAGEEVERDHVVLLAVVEGRAGDLHVDEARAVGGAGVEGDGDVARDLEPGRDGLVVVLVDHGDAALEDGAQVGAGVGQLHDGVAKGEAGQDFAAGDFAGVDGGADAAGVDEGEIRLVVAVFRLVLAVLEHRVRHDLAQKAVLALALRLVQLVLGLADALGGKLLKRAPPRLNLLVERLVRLRRVVHVDGPAVVLERLAVVAKRDVDVAQVLAPAVRRDDEDLVPAQVLDNGRVLALCNLHVAEGRVGVAADDEGEALGLGGELLVDVVADVGEGDDALDGGRVADFPDGFLDRRDGVEERRLVADVRDGRRCLRRDTNDGNVMLLKNMPILNRLIQPLIPTLDITRHDGKSEVHEELAELLIATVPLVVPERHGIEPELVDRLSNLLAAVVRVEKGALELVACVNPEVVRVLGAQGVDLGLDAGVAAVAALGRGGAVGARRGELVEMGVDVVDVHKGCHVLMSGIESFDGLGGVVSYTCCNCPCRRRSAY